MPLYGQNTKGDQPVNNKGKVRETRFKTRSKQGDRSRTKDIAGRRLRTKNTSSAGRAVITYRPPKSVRAGRKDRGDRPSKAAAPVHGTKPRDRQRAVSNRVNVRSATGKTRNVYTQSWRYVRNSESRPKDKQKPPKTNRVTVRSATGKTRNVYTQSWRYVRSSDKRPKERIRNVYPQSGRYVQNASKSAKAGQRVQSNRPQLARLRKLQTDPDPGKKKKIIPRTASRAHVGKKSINPYARFHRKRKKGEQAQTKDLAGQPLRKKNFESRRPEIVPQTYKPYYNRKRVGDRPYSGAAAGRHVSATRTKPHAWRGDIAGRKIRGKNHETRVRTGGGNIPGLKTRATKPVFGDRAHGRLKGGGYKTATRASERRAGRFPVTTRPPGVGATGIGQFKGTIKARKPERGGGSRSGRLWNNQGIAIAPRTPGIGATGLGKYQGTLKARRPGKGGGSRSGKLWNNRGYAIAPRTPGRGAVGIGKYQGTLKARRPEKGGGSRSGKLWNNQGMPVPVRTPSSAAAKAGGYPGNIKRFSRSPGFADQGEGFAGVFKTKRPKKGGQSRSGKLWNNQGNPVSVRTPSSAAAKAGGYPGNIKRFSRSPGFADQGEEFAGTLKTKRPKKGGKSISGNLWNNREAPVTVKAPSLSARKAAAHTGTQKDFGKTLRDQGEEFSGNIKLSRFRKNYVTNKNAADEAMKKARPDKSTFRAGNLQVRTKQYNYIHNKSSATAALKTREPGKALGKAMDYQGNIKMKKFELFDKQQFHPDTKFVKPNKNNVAEERDLVTNIKLLWARLFRKSETQPDHLKEKDRKPRYDKGEQGLWYD